MDHVGVPVPDMSEHATIFFEVSLTPFHVGPRLTDIPSRDSQGHTPFEDATSEADEVTHEL